MALSYLRESFGNAGNDFLGGLIAARPPPEVDRQRRKPAENEAGHTEQHEDAGVLRVGLRRTGIAEAHRAGEQQVHRVLNLRRKITSYATNATANAKDAIPATV